jgi:hypothetical protein
MTDNMSQGNLAVPYPASGNSVNSILILFPNPQLTLLSSVVFCERYKSGDKYNTQKRVQ